MKLLGVGIIFVFLGGIAAPALGDDKALARQAYEEGSKYYDLGQYGDALEAFKRAYWNYTEPTFLYNIAQCHRALKHKSEAVEFYRSYLRKSPNAANRQDVEKIVAELQVAIESEKAISTAPPEGTMPTDGRPTPTSQQPTPPPIAAPKTPAAETATVAPLAIVASPPQREKRPRRPWIWGLAGGVVAGGIALGVGLGVGLRAHPHVAPTATDGMVTF